MLPRAAQRALIMMLYGSGYECNPLPQVYYWHTLPKCHTYKNNLPYHPQLWELNAGCYKCAGTHTGIGKNLRKSYRMRP